MKKPEPTSEQTQKDFESIGTALASKGVQIGAMFGMPSLKAGGKAFAGVFGDSLVFKLEGDAHTAAIKLKGAVLFDPSGMGRPMKAWVVVPREHSKKWKGLANDALAALLGA